jgi:hypothetical protein
MRTPCKHCNVTRSCWKEGACEYAVDRDSLYDKIELSTADMLEIVASGGNGVEYVDVPALMEKAAAELREAAGRAQWTTADDVLEVCAKQLAERINGGSFYDPTFYTEEQRDLWRGHAAYFWGMQR